MKANMDDQRAYSDKLRTSAKLLGETTMHLIGCIIEKHDSAMIEVGIEMRQQIKDLQHQNDIMHDALMRISCESINAEFIAQNAIDAIAKLEGR